MKCKPCNEPMLGKDGLFRCPECRASVTVWDAGVGQRTPAIVTTRTPMLDAVLDRFPEPEPEIPAPDLAARARGKLRGGPQLLPDDHPVRIEWKAKLSAAAHARRPVFMPRRCANQTCLQSFTPTKSAHRYCLACRSKRRDYQHTQAVARAEQRRAARVAS